MIWDQLTSPELDRIDKDVPVVLAITATEQHGPHLPLATDRIIGEFFTHELHKTMPKHVLILPAVNVGCSAHHMDFSGTLTLNHESFSREIIDIVESVISHGFDRIVLINSHGGNQAIGQVLTENLGYRHPDVHFVLATWWQIAAEDLKKITDTESEGTGHGGEFETSLMMFIAPELVKEGKIKKGRTISTFSWSKGNMLKTARASYYQSIKDISPNGIVGDPTAASADKGKKIAVKVTIALKEVVMDLYKK